MGRNRRFRLGRMELGTTVINLFITISDFNYARIRGLAGYKQPDDPRAVHLPSFNRKNKYKEHYLKHVGDENSMVYPGGKY